MTLTMLTLERETPCLLPEDAYVGGFLSEDRLLVFQRIGKFPELKSAGFSYTGDMNSGRRQSRHAKQH
jgi:hypothetical protein